MSEYLADEETALLRPRDVTGPSGNNAQPSKYSTGLKITAALTLASLCAFAFSLAPTKIQNSIEANEIDLQSSAWSGAVSRRLYYLRKSELRDS